MPRVPRTKFKLALTFVFTALLATAAFGESHRQCKDLFASQSIDAIVDLKSYQVSALSPDYRKALRAHPIWNLHTQYRGGRNLVLHLPLLRAEENDRMKGEYTQTLFLSQILHELLPFAEQTDAPVATKKSLFRFKKDIRIVVGDTAEDGFDPLRRDPRDTIIQEMSRLKAANPLASSLSKKDIRYHLGLGPQDRVLHIYVDWAKALRPALLQRILTESERVYGSWTTVIISWGNITYQSDLENLSNFNDHVMNLSEYVHSRSRPPGRWILLNDTRGLMPSLHKASDLVITIGPINFFESLNAKTPTLLAYDFPLDFKSYDPNTYRRMQAQALATGGGVAVDSFSQLGPAFAKLRDIDPQQIRSPGLIKDATGRSPFEIVLDDLERLLSR